jgi:pimeloyl-ACP methyl ester carboxylesterase
MADYRDKFVYANGLNHHYLEWGDLDAPPVLLLHGTSSNAHSWDRVSAMLAKKYRAIAIDCRNHGDSDAETGPHDRAALAKDVEAIVEVLGITSHGLIGLSMGGGTAMNYAGSHPDRVNRLVIEDIGPDIPPAASAAVMTRLASSPRQVQSLDEYIAYLRQAPTYAGDDWIRHKAIHATRPLPDGGYEVKYRPFERVPTPPTTGIDLWALIAKITCPTLIVRGAESEILLEDMADRMVQVMPNARAIVIQRAGHPVHEDNPTDTIRAYAEFFDVPLD